MPKVSFRMASASRESVFGVQTNTARKIHRSDHTKGRQPGHDTTPAFTRERARRLPTPAPLRWTKRSYPLAWSSWLPDSRRARMDEEELRRPPRCQPGACSDSVAVRASSLAIARARGEPLHLRARCPDALGEPSS